MIKLVREYTCIFGAPTVAAVDPVIFSLRYFKDCMGCGFCNDICCSYGVDIDLDNVARLNAMSPDFEAFIGVARSEWFTNEIVSDPEFPAGRHVRSRVRNGRCVFLNRKARGCKIHTYCLDHGIDYHLLKPMVSALFPVTFEYGALVASNEAADGSLICSGEGPTVYEGARDELLYYFGVELVAELDGLRAQL